MPEQSDKRIPLQVFLSWRSHWTEQRQELEKSVDAYNAQEEHRYYIDLRVSEGELKQGDSIIAFMEELSLARFIILMLNHDYFASPYCLHELLEIYRNSYKADANAERLFALPVKIDLQANKITKQTILQAWQGEYTINLSGAGNEPEQEKGYCHDRLRELQKTHLEGKKITVTEQQNAHIKQQLCNAYTKHIQPLLDNVDQVCATGEELVTRLVAKADEIFSKEKDQLAKLLTRQIGQRINGMLDVDRQALADIMTTDDYSSQNHSKGLLQKSCPRAMGDVREWVENQHKQIPAESNRDWEKFFTAIENICGWLLLNSIDHGWWIHHKMQITANKKDKGHLSLGLEEPAFSEVIISRELCQAAEYCLNNRHDAIPTRFSGCWDEFPPITADDNADNPEKNTPLTLTGGLVFDAQPNARKEHLLQVLIYALKGRPALMDSSPEKLLKDIFQLGRLLRKDKYYIVSPAFLKRLQEEKINNKSILAQINSRLGEKLFFISYGLNSDTRMLPCKKEDTEDLLNLMAQILIINNNRNRKR